MKGVVRKESSGLDVCSFLQVGKKSGTDAFLFVRGFVAGDRVPD